MKYLKGIGTSARDAVAVVHRLQEFYREREDSEPMVAVNINEVVASVI